MFLIDGLVEYVSILMACCFEETIRQFIQRLLRNVNFISPFLYSLFLIPTLNLKQSSADISHVETFCKQVWRARTLEQTDLIH